MDLVLIWGHNIPPAPPGPGVREEPSSVRLVCHNQMELFPWLRNGSMLDHDWLHVGTETNGDGHVCRLVQADPRGKP